MLDTSLDLLLTRAWPNATKAKSLFEHPLHFVCFKHYAALHTADPSLVDPKTVAAWKSGEDRPSCDALGRHFAQFPDKLGLLLNFAFDGLVEALAKTMQAAIALDAWDDCRWLYQLR